MSKVLIRFENSSFLIRISFFISILAILFLATTSVKFEVVESIWDKLNHFIAFFVLYIFLTFSYKKMDFKTKFILLLFYALFIEIIQYFIPGRDFSLLDIFADAIGIIIGYMFIKIYLYIKIMKS